MNIALVLIAITSLLSGFILFDRIVKFQFENYWDEWEKIGKPSGFFLSIGDSTFLTSSLSRNIRIISWTFASDEWMKKEPSVIKKVWLMRSSIYCFWLNWIVVFVFNSKS
ncbi:MAG TPA: hypothetical protein PKY59_21345 [Pyrinomonadaceae bacterium]|nr:hypothetical protein [Pyrinomonadaceae bacterium]